MALQLKKKKIVTWPTIIQVPVDGGKFKKVTVDIDYKVESSEAFKKMAKQMAAEELKKIKARKAAKEAREKEKIYQDDDEQDDMDIDETLDDIFGDSNQVLILKKVIVGWKADHIKFENDEPTPFTEEALDEFLSYSFVVAGVSETYKEIMNPEKGALRKN